MTVEGQGRLLLLSKYTRAGASTRYRSLQYLPHLRAAGVEVTVSPLFDDAWLAARYGQGGRPVAALASAFLRRLGAVVRARRADAVLLEYEAIPYFPALPERVLAALGVPVVVDYDDALFHQYDRHRSALVRGLLGGKIAAVMRRATAVICGNAYLADHARAAGARRVEEIPTVVDADAYAAVPAPPRGDRVTVGWIGSPSTAGYLAGVAPALRDLAGLGVGVRLIGSGPVTLDGVAPEILPWREAEEIAALKRLDIGIMPLPDTPWTRGKCGFKLIQYMASGLPVVASPVGVNREIVVHGETGFLAETPGDWCTHLRRLAGDPALRARMGAAGRARMEERYSLQVTAPRVVQLIGEVMAAGRGRGQGTGGRGRGGQHPGRQQTGSKQTGGQRTGGQRTGGQGPCAA